MQMKRELPATAGDIELIDKDTLCERLKISPWTLDRKVKATKAGKGSFPLYNGALAAG
jgi:hypothetical protein